MRLQRVFFQRELNFFSSANYFSMDENASSDAERTCDRLSVIPFQEWSSMPAAEFARRQGAFKAVVDSEVKPTEFLIGEIGDFINSQEFLDKKKGFAQWMYDKAEVIKPRTFLTNYAPFYAIHWKVHQIFQSEWEKMGHTWDGFMEWAENVHIPFLVAQHIEKDHAVHSIRRYVNGLLVFASGMSETDVQKFLRISKTQKTKEKHVLCIHPDKRFPELQNLGYIRLLDVKKHLPSVGGLWDSSTYALLLRCEIDDLETTNNGEDSMVAKRALFIPMSCFTSAQKMKLCDLTGQKEYYCLADSETPSGVEENFNSTSNNEIPLRLALTDVSSIHVPDSNETLADASLEEDELYDEDNQGEGDQETLSNDSNMVLTVIGGNAGDEIEEAEEEETDEESEEYLCSICDESLNNLEDLIEHMKGHQKSKEKKKTERIMELNDLPRQSKSLKADSSRNMDLNDLPKPRLSKSLKANSSRNISSVNDSFVCECGFSSSSLSGASRHKCLKEKILLKCQFCEKQCGNSGSLKLHMKAKHKDMLKETNARAVPPTIEEQSIVEVSADEISSAAPAVDSVDVLKCKFCGKLCGNRGSLTVHVKAKHKDVTKTTTTSEIVDEVVQAECATDQPEPTGGHQQEGHDAHHHQVRRGNRRRSISDHKKKASARK